MWQLFSVVVGLFICSSNGEVSPIGKNVTLECPGTASSAAIIKIRWINTNGTEVFYCQGMNCTTNTSTHALATGDTFISFLTIQNVSMDDENEYGFKMTAFGEKEVECKRNLTITVPPIGLELVDTDGDELLQNNGSLKIAEGENKTVVCKTNAPIKPAVDLEWIIPNGLNVSANRSNYVQDVSNGRLFVPVLTLSFTPYVYDEAIVLVCRVASNSSFDDIRASIYITSEGSGTPYTTPFATKKSGPKEELHVLAIAACSGVAMLLIVLACVGGFIRSKKGAVRRSVNAESTDIRPSQGRRALPPTPSDQSHLPANHLPNQPPPAPRLPSIQSHIPMRPLVPVSEDAIRNPAERTGSGTTGDIFTHADGITPVTPAPKELDTEMDYDLLNHSHHVHRGAVSHVYRETTNGLAEYALVSRPKVNKRIDQRQPNRSKQMDDDSEYDVLNTSHQTEHGTVPHVYKETTSGLAEYANVSKPDDRKKRQSLGPLTKVKQAPINVEAEYAVVDKSKKRAK